MVAGARAFVVWCVLSASLWMAFARASTLGAQESTGRVSGRVTTPDGRPAVGAQLLLVDGIVRGVTGSDGSYELRDIPPGPHSVEFRLLGHRTARLKLDFLSGKLIRQDVQLEAEPIPLEGLEVSAPPAPNPLSPQLQGFFERRERGGGHFFTREEVTRMQARQFTDILRRVPGATLQPTSGPYGTSYVLQLARSTGLTRICPVLYFMNGTPFSIGPDNSINNYIVPEDLAGVEVYTGTARVPPQFSAGQNNSRCGVVVIWTFNGRAGRSGF